MQLGRIERTNEVGIGRFAQVPPMQEQEEPIVPNYLQTLQPMGTTEKPFYQEPVVWLIGGLLALVMLR